ncbi:MAG: threonine synthase [Halofilum sp. (in: g-proteobacteria)]|nr:threonine synthase [Halofilum sp. (in: g-proteobacteria)]
MEYRSTRGDDSSHGFASALLAGLAPDGGLFVPSRIEPLAEQTLAGLRGADYATIARELIARFAAPDIEPATIAASVDRALGNFTHPAIAPHQQLDQNRWLLELFHGPTLAFKDYALQFVGELIEHQLKREGRHATVICATSGDTGAAAASAFAGRENISVVVLHPAGRVSEVQRRQMTTLAYDNVANFAIDGDFDDCQAMVKALFVDPAAAPLNLTAVNSINWARITCQVAYYAWSSMRLGGAGPVNYIVPTGNFGNILAADVARRLGFPVGHLVLTSNDNDVLPRFFETGRMERRDTRQTISPSMDIQVSSNFERALWFASDGDTAAVSEWQRALADERAFSVDAGTLGRLRERFSAARCTEAEALEEMARTWRETGTMICPHTATAAHAARTLDLDGPVVVAATAHPAKFPDAVRQATGHEPPRPDLLESVMEAPERYREHAADAGALRDLLLQESPR